MSIIYLTLIISTIVAIVFFIIFIISLRKGQYDDTYTPSVRMLFDDEIVKKKPSEHKNTGKISSRNTTTINNSDH